MKILRRINIIEYTSSCWQRPQGWFRLSLKIYFELFWFSSTVDADWKATIPLFFCSCQRMTRVFLIYWAEWGATTLSNTLYSIQMIILLASSSHSLSCDTYTNKRIIALLIWSSSRGDELMELHSNKGWKNHPKCMLIWNHT